MILVVDASVACKWFVEEKDSAAAEALLGSGASLLAPDLLAPEFVNVAWTKLRRGEIGEAQAKAMVAGLPNLFDELVPSHTLAGQAFAIATALDHPAYDCFYLALAKAHGGRLVTADRRLLARLSGTPWQAVAQPLT